MGKTVFSFCVEVATMLGIEEAIMVYDLDYLLTANKHDNINFRAGTWWTYKTHASVTKRHPYMTKDKVRYVMKKLEDNNIIIVRHYSEGKYDKVRWYSFNPNMRADVKAMLTFYNDVKIDNHNKKKESGKNPTQGVGIFPDEGGEIPTISYTKIAYTIKDNNLKQRVLSLLEDDKFKDIWNDWVMYRQEIKSPLTERSIKQQFILLATEDYEKCIKNSITNGYIGLFPTLKRGQKKEVNIVNDFKAANQY